MPSGYEKSPDYGGLEPNFWLWGALIFVIGVCSTGYFLL